MINITNNIKEKPYYLFNNKEGKYQYHFLNYYHVLRWLNWEDLKDIGHNRNDKNKETKLEFYNDYHYPFSNSYKTTQSPKPYIILDSLHRVVHKDQLAKDIELYQVTYPNPYRAKRKKGTNKQRAWGGYRHNTSYSKNVVAELIGDAHMFPLSRGEAELRYRLYDWDNSMRSNKGDNWKLQKKKHQWDKKC